jgi:hypothetical protein
MSQFGYVIHPPRRAGAAPHAEILAMRSVLVVPRSGRAHRRDSSAAIHDYRARSADESPIDSNAFACVSTGYGHTRPRHHLLWPAESR